MALIQSGLIWVTYAVTVAILLFVSGVFVFVYQKPRDRAASVTTVCIITMSALLATLLLLPVDVALVDSTNISKEGRKKEWATPDTVENILFSLRIVYYTLYSFDAILVLLVVPFTYFWYEEGDEIGAEEGTQTCFGRFWGSLKYTIGFVVLCVILFLVGFFLPSATKKEGKHTDLDYFKDLLSQNHGERALTFALGLLITLGTFTYVLYTSSGMALMPVALIKSAPGLSAPSLAVHTGSQLDRNRERQRQLEMRNEGRARGLDARDRRELEALVREERTLVRRERLAAESRGEGQSFLVKSWNKIGALLRPLKLVGGILLIVLALLIFVSMLITAIDKARNSICKSGCGYVLGHINIFQPINWIFVQSSKIFPVDYIIFILLVIFLFTSSVVGIATIGIRFLWVVLFRIRKGHTSPQALLLACILMSLIILAVQYDMAMLVAPQYATFGSQTYCDRAENSIDRRESCVKPCSEVASNPAAKRICTPSVASTFLNRVTINFPFFGIVLFWAQFAFMGVFLVVFLTVLFRTPKLNMREVDADLEEEEEEGLLASTGRRFGATWQDITGRAKRARSYGTQNDYDRD